MCSLKKIRKRCITRLLKGCAQRNTTVNMLGIYHAYAESAFSRHICMNEGRDLHMTCNFFFYAPAMK